jgi:protein-tyrosine phosphatase
VVEKKKILFVCTGNICRSPTAQGILEKFLIDSATAHAFWVDSAGISNYHVGEAPDPRTQKAALMRGVDLSAQRARQIMLRDFYEFDFIIAMDSGHLDELLEQKPDDARSEVHRLLDYCHDIAHKDVPDPYYGGSSGFERVFDVCEAGCRSLYGYLRNSAR